MYVTMYVFLILSTTRSNAKQVRAEFHMRAIYALVHCLDSYYEPQYLNIHT